MKRLEQTGLRLVRGCVEYDHGDTESHDRVALWLSRREADALFALLVDADPGPHVSESMNERLLCSVAAVCRSFDSAAKSAGGGTPPGEKMLDCSG